MRVLSNNFFKLLDILPFTTAMAALTDCSIAHCITILGLYYSRIYKLELCFSLLLENLGSWHIIIQKERQKIYYFRWTVDKSSQ